MHLPTFKGGVHPYEGKELSKDSSIRELIPKGQMVYPLSQHIGAPATPVVKVGDHVLVGQKLAEASGFISANVLSSVSGDVIKIEPRLTPSGNMINSIVIDNDDKYEAVEGLGEKRDVDSLSKEQIRELVKEAGIVGMGGAAFPTHVKITPKDDSKIDYVIVNGAECEPYLTSDYRVMLEEAEQVIGGLKIVLKLFDNAKGIIGVENNKPDAIAHLQKLLENESGMGVCPVQTKYPQGGERMLIYAVTGRKINSSMLPADAGCVVINIDTAASIYRAVAESTPLIRRIITVTGDAITNPVNLSVKTGTSYTELIEAAGGFKTEPAKVVSGGPMMGTALFSMDVPVVKNSSALLAMTKDEAAIWEPSACIRCGKCVTVCPENLIPQKLMECSEHGDTEGFEKLNGMECCECGSCTYICPAKRRLTQSFKEARKTVMANRRKA